MTDNTQELDMMPDELDMFIATHTVVSNDTDDGVYREAEYYALKRALDSLIKKQTLELLYGLFDQRILARDKDSRELSDPVVPLSAIEAELNKLKESSNV